MTPGQGMFAVCVPCWRQGVSMTAEMPRGEGWPEERCTICSRRTNHGIYLTREQLDACANIVTT